MIIIDLNITKKIHWNKKKEKDKYKNNLKHFHLLN